jgi:cob(I)alamin adenosyltransferase
MGLYTRKGDDGRTSLMDGRRVPKDDPHVVACGAVDELNSVLGWCRCAAGSAVLNARIEQIQQELFSIGAELATPPDAQALPGVQPVGEPQVGRLETWIDEACGVTKPLGNFVLPGGCELAARLHLARTCCRRAERAVVCLHAGQPTCGQFIMYLNRLGDLLFAWARQANQDAGVTDVLWKPSQ